MPSKEEILRKARELSMLEQMRVGLPAITPTEAELKETGMFYEARRSLMTVDADVKAQQMSYLEELASELDMQLVSRRDFEKIIHARATPTRRKKAEPKIQLRTVIKKTVVGKKKLEPKRKVTPKIIKRFSDRTSRFQIYCERCRKVVSNKHKCTRKFPKKTESQLAAEIFGRPKKPSVKKDLAAVVMNIKPKKKTKRKKRTTTRTGKTMRALRKVNGVRVFSFSDDIWKVRPTRKKKR